MTRLTLSRRGLAALGLMSAACALTPPPAASARSRCAAAPGRTVVATRDARAYRRHGMTFACMYRSRRTFRLGDFPADPDSSRARLIRLAGPYVGYELEFIGRHETRFAVRVRDLRSGRWLHRTRATTAPPGPVFSTSFPGVRDLELARNGAVAWIARDPYVEPAAVEVHKADAHGHAQLASGAGIDTHSLALSGSTVYWLDAGAPRAATLR